MAIGRKRVLREETENPCRKRTRANNSSPSSLLDITAKCVASHFPYQEIEEKVGFVPAPVQSRVMYYSFPRNEKCIELYSSNKLYISSSDVSKQPFHTGVKLVESKAVHDVVQIGFHLSGVVHEKVGICNRQKTHNFKCSMNFDRNCITSTECSCNSRSLLWCPHVVAVALYRIRNPDLIPIKPPISDSVVGLKQEEIQKLLLTLVSKHSNSILPAVQELLDELRKPESEINLLSGIPDPTAGAYCNEDNTWHIDEENINKQIRHDLQEGSPGKNIICLMTKVREMMAVQDRNCVNLLRTITDAIFNETLERPQIQNCQRTRRIYDELQSLWFCVMFNPNFQSSTKNGLTKYLKSWRERIPFLKENVDETKSSFLLDSVLTSNSESLVAQAASIEALNICGHSHDALLIAKQFLKNLKRLYNTGNSIDIFSKSTEPIFIVYNTFIEHKLENKAYELALLSLSHSFNLPKGEYAQSRLTHRYERLISQIEQLDLTKPILRNTLLQYANELLEHITSLLVKPMEHDILPNHCLVRFLFERLLTIDHSLAFQLSLPMLTLNLNRVENDDEDDGLLEGLSYNGTFCYISSHLEYQQGELAACILRECTKHPEHMKMVMTSILEDIKQPSQLLKLAKLCQSIAVARQQNQHIEIVSAAFELGVRSIRLIREEHERKSCIRWLVSCAVDTGRQAVDFILRNWTDLFTPREVSNDIAPMLTSQPVFFHLKLHSNDKREEFLNKIRNMVIEACIKEPVPCVLFALTLCEDHVENFELVCQITLESSHRFNPAQLFSVARYLESKKHLYRAFKIGIQALKKLDIGALDCQHPAICDVLWISTLACNLGMDELTQIVPVIENCIHNPILLTEIAERCSNKAYNKCNRDISSRKEPLNRLVASAQKLFVQDIELKLQSITRKNYNEFSEYLRKIKRSFLLSEDGHDQFQWLLDYIIVSQKGKKKLHQVITEKFINNTEVSA